MLVVLSIHVYNGGPVTSPSKSSNTSVVYHALSENVLAKMSYANASCPFIVDGQMHTSMIAMSTVCKADLDDELLLDELDDDDELLWLLLEDEDELDDELDDELEEEELPSEA